MNNFLRKWSPLFIIVVTILIIDQISKAWVVANMQIGQTISLPVLSPFIQITRSTNTGAAFGIFPDFGDFFLVASALITLVILYFYARSEDDARLQRIALALVVGGALGNLTDRIQHGAVVDFVHIRIPNLIANVSNFADHAIVLGDRKSVV